MKVLAKNNGTWYTVEISEGQFSGNLLNGWGRCYNSETSTLYEGQWVNDKWQGHGKLTFDNKDIYEG